MNGIGRDISIIYRKVGSNQQIAISDEARSFRTAGEKTNFTHKSYLTLMPEVKNCDFSKTRKKNKKILFAQ